MRRYWGKKIKAGFANLLLILGLILTVASCADIDNNLGSDFIPDDQLMRMKVDSIYTIRTYNVMADSFSGLNNPYNYVGSYYDESTGIGMNASFIFQFMSPDIEDITRRDTLYGTNPVTDSIRIVLTGIKNIGNTEIDQEFEIYELKEQPPYDTIYYTFYDPSELLKDKPMLTFTYRGEDSLTYTVTDPDVLKQFADTTGFFVDTVFRKRFPGLYIKPKNNFENASLRKINLQSSYLMEYFHNDEHPDTALQVQYWAYPYDAVTYPYSYNISIQSIEYDYSRVKPEVHLNDDNHSAEFGYVQGYGGIQTLLKFPKDDILGLKEKAKAEGFRDLVVNHAKLEIFYPAREPEILDDMYGRLGMYLDPKTFEGIPDYYWLYEDYYGYEITYDGYINRSRFLYEMDVTNYVTAMFTDDDYEKFDVYLAPAYAYYTQSYNYTLDLFTEKINGFGSDAPLNLVITYTMVR